MQATSQVNVVDIVCRNGDFFFVTNPELEIMPYLGEHRELVEKVLDIALELIRSGQVITFTHRPNIDLMLSLSLDESGVIMIDSSGGERFTIEEAQECLRSVLKNF